MYAVTGITGQVGGVTGRALINTGLSVRAVVRDAAKGAAWKKCGCEVALADMNDASSLTAAFMGTSGVFVLIPSNFDPEPGFHEVRAVITALASAISAAKPPKVVFLFDHRCANDAAKPAQPARLGGAGAGCIGNAGLLPAGCLVHGKFSLGRRTGAG